MDDKKLQLEKMLSRGMDPSDVSRIVEALFDSNSAARASVRLNPSKVDSALLDPEIEYPLSIAGEAFCCQKVAWEAECGRYLSERPSYTADPLLHAGAYYVQDSSSMIVGTALERVLTSCGGEGGWGKLRVLDACAAPGGKTTHIATVLNRVVGDRGWLLLANEYDRIRAGVLRENVSKWGDPRVVVSSCDTADIARCLPEYFDIIVADVPCSGEGMFRKEEAARQRWSPEYVRECASLQKKIVQNLISSLNPGGYLIYSTCTFNSLENEVPLQFPELECCSFDLLESFDGFIKSRCGYVLAPGFTLGEGQSVGIFRKRGIESEFFPAMPSQRYQPVTPPKGYRPQLLAKNLSASMQVSLGMPMDFSSKDGIVVKAVPSDIAAQVIDLESRIRVIQSGVHVYDIKGRDFIPQTELALCRCFRSGPFPTLELDLPDALVYLSCSTDIEAVASSAGFLPNGFVCITYMGRPLGFIKNLGRRFNNLYPRAWAVKPIYVEKTLKNFAE